MINAWCLEINLTKGYVCEVSNNPGSLLDEMVQMKTTLRKKMCRLGLYLTARKVITKGAQNLLPVRKGTLKSSL